MARLLQATFDGPRRQVGYQRATHCSPLMLAVAVISNLRDSRSFCLLRILQPRVVSIIKLSRVGLEVKSDWFRRRVTRGAATELAPSQE